MQRAAVVHQLLGVVDDGAGLLGQLGHPGQAAAGHGLVARHDQADQLGLVVQHLEHRHRGHRRAVGVGDDALRAGSSRHAKLTSETTSGTCGVLAERRRVVDHRHAGRGEPRRLDPRHRRARGEQRDVQTGRVGRLGVLDLDLLAAERQLAALRAGRGEEPHVGRREITLVEQRCASPGRPGRWRPLHRSTPMAPISNVPSPHTPWPPRHRRGRMLRVTRQQPCLVQCRGTAPRSGSPRWRSGRC